MPSPVNRARRNKAFNRGYERPQLFNPYKNPVLGGLWKRGREARLKKTGGVMPAAPVKREHRTPKQAQRNQHSRPQPGRDQSARPPTGRARRDGW